MKIVIQLKEEFDTFKKITINDIVTGLAFYEHKDVVLWNPNTDPAFDMIERILPNKILFYDKLSDKSVKYCESKNIELIDINGLELANPLMFRKNIEQIGNDIDVLIINEREIISPVINTLTRESKRRVVYLTLDGVNGNGSNYYGNVRYDVVPNIVKAGKNVLHLTEWQKINYPLVKNDTPKHVVLDIALNRSNLSYAARILNKDSRKIEEYVETRF